MPNLNVGLVAAVCGILVCGRAMGATKVCGDVICPAGQTLNYVTCTCVGTVIVGPTLCTDICEPCEEWVDGTTGYQERICYVNDADCNCVETTDLRCASGYYAIPDRDGNVVDGSCYPCPDDGWSEPDNSSIGIEKCFLPDGAIRDDEVGLYEITGAECYYNFSLDL